VSSGDYYREREIRHLRQAMSYTQADYSRDWKLVIALAKLLADDPGKRHLEGMLESAFNRMFAWHELEGRYPWEDSDGNHVAGSSTERSTETLGNESQR
jgi:hypothetical protein